MDRFEEAQQHRVPGIDRVIDKRRPEIDDTSSELKAASLAAEIGTAGSDPDEPDKALTGVY